MGPTDQSPSPAASLEEALHRFGVRLDPERSALLDKYRALLWEWNERLNLTRHTTFEKFVGRDVVDSLQLSALIPPGRRVVDIGSGSGVPGLILAICRPDLRVALCDSTQKKARVLQSMAEQLGAPAEVHGCRVEELLALRTFDVATARAVAPLAKLLTWLEPHWEAVDELLVIKGRNWAEERGEARHRGLLKRLELRRAAVYPMPEGDGESVVLRLWPKGRFPQGHGEDAGRDSA